MQEIKNRVTPALSGAFGRYVDAYKEYYSEWQYDQPLVSSVDITKRFRVAGIALGKIIKGIAAQFTAEDYKRYLPVSARSKEVIDIFNRFEFKSTGTFRTDFVFDTELNPQFIEITCQFPLNGYFQSAVFNEFSKDIAKKYGVASSRIQEYEPFIPFLAEKLGDHRSVCVIKGWDQIQTSRFYVPLLKDAGFDVREISYKDVWQHREFIASAHVISEIMISEIESMTDEEIELIAQRQPINDYRTIMIAHDKRFFALLCNREIISRFLTSSEIEVLSEFLIPTYSLDDRTLDFDQLIRNKDAWILKHINLGRSREIFAGAECSESEWRDLVNSVDASNFVIQAWVPQKTFQGTVNSVSHPKDFLTGTLLYFDEEYFGQGLYRASSHFVANKTDNRNISPMVLPDLDLLADDCEVVACLQTNNSIST